MSKLSDDKITIIGGASRIVSTSNENNQILTNNLLKGKVAVVTGATGGIGRAIAERLGQNGANVVVNYVRGKDVAHELVTTIEERGGKAALVQADVSRVSDIRRLFEETVKLFGSLDIVVTTAGIQIHKPITETTEEEYDRLFAINAKGTFFTLQEAIKHIADGGCIITLSSSLTTMMVPGYGAYCGTKGAVEQYTKTLAKEVGKRGIRVNAVAPGPVETELLTSTETKESLQFLAGLAAFGRLGEPADIANVVAFLVSEQGRWISGQTIRANGALV